MDFPGKKKALIFVTLKCLLKESTVKVLEILRSVSILWSEKSVLYISDSYVEDGSSKLITVLYIEGSCLEWVSPEVGVILKNILWFSFSVVVERFHIQWYSFQLLKGLFLIYI